MIFHQGGRLLDEPYTKIPNRLIKSAKLDVYEKCVLITIMSYSPSFPSYEKIAADCGISRDRVWKSLRKLEAFNLITRFKEKFGQRIVYRSAWTSLPDGLFDTTPVRYTDSTSPPHVLVPVRRADPNKNKEKEQLISDSTLLNGGSK